MTVTAVKVTGTCQGRTRRWSIVSAFGMNTITREKEAGSKGELRQNLGLLWSSVDGRRGASQGDGGVVR